MKNAMAVILSLFFVLASFALSMAADNDQTSATKTATSASQRGVKEAGMGQRSKINKETMRHTTDRNQIKAGKDTSPGAKPGDPPWMRVPQKTTRTDVRPVLKSTARFRSLPNDKRKKIDEPMEPVD
ncbi:MAG: hypothetical protein ACYC69_11105 [Thermodesulfovibrionales bacterium]